MGIIYNIMNQEDKKQMTEVVGEALEAVILPELFEIKKDVKVLKDDMKEVKSTLKDHGEQLKDHTERFEDIDQRLEKVELNTRVYPYDKEHVETKLGNHELRIGKLETKHV